MARKAEVVSDALIKESLTDGSTRLAVSLIMRPPTICRRRSEDDGEYRLCCIRMSTTVDAQLSCMVQCSPPNSRRDLRPIADSTP